MLILHYLIEWYFVYLGSRILREQNKMWNIFVTFSYESIQNPVANSNPPQCLLTTIVHFNNILFQSYIRKWLSIKTISNNSYIIEEAKKCLNCFEKIRDMKKVSIFFAIFVLLLLMKKREGKYLLLKVNEAQHDSQPISGVPGWRPEYQSRKGIFFDTT